MENGRPTSLIYAMQAERLFAVFQTTRVGI